MSSTFNPACVEELHKEKFYKKLMKSQKPPQFPQGCNIDHKSPKAIYHAFSSAGGMAKAGPMPISLGSTPTWMRNVLALWPFAGGGIANYIPYARSWEACSSCTPKEFICSLIVAQKSHEVVLSLAAPMPSVPKADLVQILAALGEQAPPSWPVMEIKNRIQELQEAQRGKKQRAPLAEQMTRLNVASRRKGNLADYMRQELDMPVNPNDTVAQMQRQAIKKIYMTTKASGTDPVGFGEHSALSCRRSWSHIHSTAIGWRRRLKNKIIPSSPTAQVGKAGSKGQDLNQAADSISIYASSIQRGNSRDDGQDDGHGEPAQGGGRGPEARAASEESRHREDRVCEQFQTGEPLGLRSEDDAPLGGETIKKLPHVMSHFLGQCVDDMLPQAFSDLVSVGRLELLEIACSQDSILTSTMQKITGRKDSAERLSIWNGCDLSTNQGVRKAIQVISLKETKTCVDFPHLWSLFHDATGESKVSSTVWGSCWET